jgi:predicted acetyltransferase
MQAALDDPRVATPVLHDPPPACEDAPPVTHATEDYGPARETDLLELGQTLSWSFGFPPADSEPWLRRAGLENVRVVRRGGRIAACLLLIPMGQYFGGRSVPMVGVAGVATPADMRGSGAAVAMMKRLVLELAEKKVPLSGLYPATRPLYRRAGWEVAGSRLELSVSVRSLGKPDRTLPVRAAGDADARGMEELYRSVAARMPGHLDRGPYVWFRVRSPRDAAARAFVVGEGSNVDGYVVLFQRRSGATLDYDVRVTDIAARTPAAYRRLLTVLADHGTIGESVVWNGGPGDPLLMLLPDRHYEARDLWHWMIRITDVEAALTARGYPPGLRAEAELDVTDELVAGNVGRYVLQVADGKGEVRRGGRGLVKVDVRGLAPLYSGHLSAHALHSLGMLEGPEGELAKAEAIFAGGEPWMRDFF